MRLSYVKVVHFRGIERGELRFRDFTSLIGPNNSCKSTFLHAIELLLSTKVPDPDDWSHSDRDRDIVIEAEFTDLQEWERDRPGVSSLVHDGRIYLRYTGHFDAERGKPTFGYEVRVPRESISGWSDKWGELSEPIKDVAKSIGIEDGKKFMSGANKIRVKDALRTERPELVTRGTLEFTSEGISIEPALQQALPLPIFIPAVRDASDESSSSPKSAFGQLLQRILLPAIKETDEYHQMQAAVTDLQSRICGVDREQCAASKLISDEITARIKRLIDARVELSLSPPDVDKMFGPSVGISIDDGFKGPVNLQGHGLQRALIYSLLEILAEHEAKVSRAGAEGEAVDRRSTILLFEEPELFIHPHLMRKLKHILKQLSGGPGWQVVVTTHSPFLIDVADDPRSLVLFKRPSLREPPSIIQLECDPFAGGDGREQEREMLRATIDFHPTVCEAFFAHETILVEGDSELAVLKFHPRLYELCGVDIEQVQTRSVIACGGKWTIPAFARLLKAFGVPFRVVHDLDRRGRGEAALADSPPFDPYRANRHIVGIVGEDKVFICEDTLEDILWRGDGRVPSKDKPYLAWKRVRELCDNPTLLEEHARLKELVRFVFGHLETATMRP